MSFIITGILNSTIGLLWNKARDTTATKLQEGDVTDVKIREIIVRELNDIKTKLDGLSRRNLLSSYSFLKEGVELLKVCLDRTTHSTQDDRGESLTMSSNVASAILNEVFELTHAVKNVKIKSCALYETARERFKDARKEATKAFCNEALKIDDRIFAAKLRVVSEILENLESPQTAVIGCLSFLGELHSLPAIREIFSVYLNGGVKSFLSKEERASNVKSVMLINCVLFQFTLKFGAGNFTDRLTNWPDGIIELVDRSFNPVFEWQKISSRKSMGGELGQPPNVLLLDEEIIPRLSAVSSHGEIVVRHGKDEIKIISRTGETKVVKLPSEHRDSELISRHTKALAFDDAGSIYVVSYLETRTEADNITTTYVLHVLDDDYNVKHVGTLAFLDKINRFLWISIAINKDNDIVMIKEDDSSVYTFGNSGKLKHKFERDTRSIRKLGVSNKNKIMIVSDDKKAVNFYTGEGNLTSTVKLPEGHAIRGQPAFHYVLDEMMVLTYVKEKESYFLLNYSDRDELESAMLFSDVIETWSPFMTSHPAGPAAVVREKSITFI